LTRVYERPDLAPGEACTRALVIGAGYYPDAKNLEDLTSVGPSVREFVAKLIRDWGSDLAAPLYSVDLLLSDPAYPGGTAWSALGVVGEIPDRTNVEQPTLTNVDTALTASLRNSKEMDHFLFLCCGHGFSTGEPFFVLSDFDPNANNPWTSVVNLRKFAVGLRQKKPRHQWLFLDCCNDFSDEALETLGDREGNPLIRATVKQFARAQRASGTPSQFCWSSSTVGAKSFGVPDKPSRFCEILIDALERSGAVQRYDDAWWIDEIGIRVAGKTYAERKADLVNPEFYVFADPVHSDSRNRMRLRRLAHEPTSCLIAVSVPPIAGGGGHRTRPLSSSCQCGD
jgi:hypothetical protein